MLPSIFLALQLAGSTVGSTSVEQVATATATAETAGARQARATRAGRAPVLDGRAEDDVWQTAQRVTAFRQFDPVEDGEPTMATEAQVAYDDRYFYAFVRAFDPRPDSIRSYLSRRDVKTSSDQIGVFIDSYHDRRTGYEFIVNPAGVKFDAAVSGDGDREDDSWDCVWDVATRIDDKGWTAEFRIPLSQLRYANEPSLTFGIAFFRQIARTNVLVSWPLYRRSRPGMVSQFGEVTGIDGLAAPRRLAITPYTLAKDASVTRADDSFGRSQQATAGVDIKYGVTSNLTVDATVNPDFGQVEADPSVLNLSAFEQYYQERRPFFLEGAGIFRYDLDCNDGQCSGLFYSRRIGRSPQLADEYGDASTKQNTNIVAAAKLTGRLSNGLSVGILDAATERVSGPLNETVEPRTNYFAGRLTQDLRNGKSAIGLMLTATNRQLDRWSQDHLRRAGYTLGVDARHKFAGDNYEVTGNLAASRVDGTAAAIERTQRDAVHYYQRPDGGPGVDSTLTSLEGYTSSIGLGKIGGGVTRFFTGLKRTSPGFEINDAGFLPRADVQSWNNWFALQYRTPTSWYRSAQVNFNSWTAWNTSGLMREVGGNVGANAQFKNQWWSFMGFNVNGFRPTYDDRASRGGPALRQEFNRSAWAGVETDQRWRFSPGLFVHGRFKDVAGTWNYGINQSNTVRVSSRLQVRLGASLFRQSDDAQWYDNYTDALTKLRHYTFARLDQTVTSLTARLDFTATPTLSLQLYASPFITSGQYTNWRELNDPSAERYADRFKPYTGHGDPEGFNFKQFRSNTVIRWEYRPGSALFLVWAQGREQDGVDVGSFSVSRDAGNLFRQRPDNTFLIKSSYWFNW